MLSQSGSVRDKPKEIVRDRKKLASQSDMRGFKALEDKMTFSSPKFVNYTISATQKNSSAKKLNFGITSPKGFYPQYRKEGSIESRHGHTKSDSLKLSSTRMDGKSLKEHVLTEGIAKIDQAFNSIGPQITSKNISFPSRKSLKTDVSTVETKTDAIEKAVSPKYEEKYKAVKQNEVIKQIEAQIQLHRRVKKPAHVTKSVALTSTMRDSSMVNESKLSEGGSQRRSSSTKGVPWGKLDLPVKPEVVLDRYSYNLAPHEKLEILNYPEIYYISDMEHKLPVKDEAECDDERGDYIVIRNDHIQYRYEVLEMLGRGSFGQVIKALDHKTQEHVAIKLIRSPKKFHGQAKIEIKVLKYMMQHRGGDFNITELKGFFVFRKHVCLVFDLMSLNLYDFLKKNKFKGFSLSVIRKFAIQILYALKFLSHHKIIHCDLKPENILLKQINKTGIKLIDFGSSCFESEKLYTYIQSRFYRSPEIILGLSYNTQIDMWSFGCLLCELYLGYPIFAGDSEHDQLLAMMEVLGPPEQRLITQSPKRAKFFEDDLAPKVVPNTKGRIRKPSSIPMESILNCEDESFVDLIRKCLVYDPNERFTSTAALGHDWILSGLPPELKSQHMKLLEKTATTSAVVSTRTVMSTSKERGNMSEVRDSHEYAIIKPEKKVEESSQRGKHKKTISESLQRTDFFKEQKTAPSFHHYKKSMMNMTNTYEDESMNNLTLGLNESKQSIGTTKIPTHIKQNSFTSPQSLGIKEKTGVINNFFCVTNGIKNNTSFKSQEAVTTPKRTQTMRDGCEEEVANAINGLRTTFIGDFRLQKMGNKLVSHKSSSSIEKKFGSPKTSSDSFLKAFRSEEHGNMSASRLNGFSGLRSPIKGK